MTRTLLLALVSMTGAAYAETAVRQTSGTYVVTLPAGDAPLADAGTMTPVGAGAAVTGLKVGEVAPESTFWRIGLRTGDIIRGIDNRPVSGVEPAMAALRKGTEAGRIFLHVERDGHRLALTYIIERRGPSAKPAATDTKPTAPPIAEWIRTTGERTWSIHRPGLNAMLADPAPLYRSARIVPAREGDAFVGFKLFGVRKGSIPEALGLKSGDILRTVNGLPLSSPDEALAIYSRLRQASDITLTVTRGGAAVNLRYTIDDDIVEPPPGAP